MDVEGEYDGTYLHEEVSPNREGNAWDFLTRVELDVAYSSERALNLEILLMQVADREIDYEALAMENDDNISTESVVRAFEFDVLCGILNAEVKELDSFMASLQLAIADTGHYLYQCACSQECSEDIIEKLHDADDSLKQTQDLVVDVRTRADKYESNLASGNGAHMVAETDEYSPTNAKWKQHNVEQQRHILQMLEKSLARELDLEKKMLDVRYDEEEMKLKLHYAEQETYSLEESMEQTVKRMFEAENSAGLFFGIAKELAGKLQIVQFKLNGSMLREREMRPKMKESMSKFSAEGNAPRKPETCCAKLDDFTLLQSPKSVFEEAEDKCTFASSEIFNLREKVSALEEQLRESDSQLKLASTSFATSHEQQSMLHAELSKKEHVIEGLRGDVSRLESKVESAETSCALLTKTNVELNEQLGSLKSHEQQSMLHAELSEKEHVIEGLRGDVSRLESRVESAETQCAVLTETNMELNEQLGSLKTNGSKAANLLERKRKQSDMQLEHAKASVEELEEQQKVLFYALSDMEKLIEDLKGKVSIAERRAENAESTCTSLTETNLKLSEKLAFLWSRLECLEASLNRADDKKIVIAKDIGVRTKFITDLVMKLALERERLQLKVEKSAAAPTENTVPADDSLRAASNLEIVRIEATQLNLRYLFMAVLVLLVSSFAINRFELEDWDS